MITTIRSERLDLVPLGPEFLQAIVQHNLEQARRVLGFSLPVGLVDSVDVMSLRLQQLEADATFQPWSLRAMILRKRGEMIGHIGFHTQPGAEYLRLHAPGGVEFGFEVFPPFRRQGYAREASLTLMRWAHELHDVTRFVLSIRPDNTASQSLAACLGFSRIGSHIDEVDGLEDILELRLCDDHINSLHRKGASLEARE
jgi:[ribosomal protein S5]-alanine N-acetyltransferase